MPNEMAKLTHKITSLISFNSVFILYFAQVITIWCLYWLHNGTIYGISVIYVTAHRCAGGLKKKLDLRSGSNAIDIS